MPTIHHKNFGWLHAPPFPPACCHGLVVEDAGKIVLVDTGIGNHDIADPYARIGKENVDAAGFQFLPKVTAAAQLAQMGFAPDAVTDIVLTHADHDHVGGLADFPNATVHFSTEEKQCLDSHHPRYSPAQFSHGPKFQTYTENNAHFFDLPARTLTTSIEATMYLVPLFGHTLGHCGVAIAHNDRWIFHIGDAYYLQAELDDPDHPVGQLATLRAEDNDQRLASLEKLRQLRTRAGDQIDMFGYHDTAELPTDIQTFEDALSAHT